MWSAALQLCFAVFGIGAYTRSKVEVRQSIDEMNAALKTIIAADLHKHAMFKEDGQHYFALIAAAAVLSLTGFTLSDNILPLVQKTVHNVARLQDGLLLADARKPGPKRDFQLRFIVKLINNNIGSMGIVQNADAPVHQQQVDGFPLEILPCVTLYPGMKEPFAIVA